MKSLVVSEKVRTFALAFKDMTLEQQERRFRSSTE